jgi:hypothetical protein
VLKLHLTTTSTTRGLSHCDLAIYIKKYLKANGIMEIETFHHAKI